MPLLQRPSRHPRRLLAALCACAMTSALAAETSTLRVSASIAPGCRVNGDINPQAGKLGSLDFGQQAALATGNVVANLAANGAVTLSCTPGMALTMSIDGGGHYNDGERNLAAGNTRIPYRLYADAALSRAIPVGQPMAVDYDTPANIRLPVYAVLTLPGNNPPGTYLDVLTVTLSW